MLSYVLFFFVVLFGMKKPEVAKVLDPFLKYMFWDNPNPYIRETLKVRTIDAVKLEKSV